MLRAGGPNGVSMARPIVTGSVGFSCIAQEFAGIEASQTMGFTSSKS